MRSSQKQSFKKRSGFHFASPSNYLLLRLQLFGLLDGQIEKRWEIHCIERLMDEMAKLQRSVDAATTTGDDIDLDVEKIQAGDKAERRCSIGLCLDVMPCYKHSKKAKAKVRALAELIAKADKLVFHRGSYCLNQQETVGASARVVESFPLREVVLDRTKDLKIQQIGVFGMQGVGKIMLIRNCTS